MNILAVFIFVGLVFVFVFRRLRNSAIRKSASYQLYSVRDELICLVAEGRLDEKSRVFQYYYKRVNLFLDTAPNVGLDHAMESFLYLKNSKDFEASLSEAKKRADEMLGLVESEGAEVSQIVANYYSSSKNMMLAHSSILRMLYIVYVKSPLSKLIALKNVVPKGTYAILKTARFADDESHQFRNITERQIHAV